jgi:hypothetical protein
MALEKNRQKESHQKLQFFEHEEWEGRQTLLCPRCHHHNLHQGEWSLMRHYKEFGYLLDVRCEGCGQYSTISIIEYKGSIYLSARPTLTGKRLNLKNYEIRMFQHIDDDLCQYPLDIALKLSYDLRPYETGYSVEEHRFVKNQLIQDLGEAFTQAGWVGDGTIGCIAVPPFVTPSNDGFCELVFHVKSRSSNGVSFLAIPKYLLQHLQGVLEQDKWYS